MNPRVRERVKEGLGSLEDFPLVKLDLVKVSGEDDVYRVRFGKFRAPIDITAALFSKNLLQKGNKIQIPKVVRCELCCRSIDRSIGNMNLKLTEGLFYNSLIHLGSIDDGQ
jgi:hypothetical protein